MNTEPLVQGVPNSVPRGDGDACGIEPQAHHHDVPAWERPCARPVQATAALYRIRSGVARVQRPTGMVLVEPAEGRSVRVSTAAYDLVPLLVEGASFESLARRLQERHPRAADVDAKLRRFLGQLDEAGLIGTAEPARARSALQPWVAFDADPLARRLAAPLLRLPAAVGWALLALLGAAAVAVLVARGGLPHPMALFTQFSVLGLLLFIGVVVPLHEAAHALACRLAGVAVGDAGLMLHGGVMPGPYVNTSRMYHVARRTPRFWVAAAGPVVDALGAGAAAAWLLADPGNAAAQTLLLLCAVFVILDTNPLAPSDGSRMVEALLGDELARRSALTRERARLSHFKTVAWYRIACSLHLQASAALLVAWWLLVPQQGAL